MRTTFRLSIMVAALAAVSTFAAMQQANSHTSPAAPAPTVTPSAPAIEAPAPAVTTEPSPENPDSRHPTGDVIEISIAKQRLTAWRDGKVVYRFVISAGRAGYETPPGHYTILEKYENRWSRKWSVWMPYAMRWYQGYFIHQLPHKDGSSYNIGASKLGRPDSHGCVRVDVGDAERLFRWTKIGTPVWVH